ncbi:MAG: type II toxin-antitoxin system VapC family toxin [Syntrophobacteraceae bacterium]
MRVFFDTSAFVKRYIEEPGTDKVVEICYVTPDVVTETLRCLESNALRAMDALHLGSALIVEPDLFVSSAHRQLEAARREGLEVMEV